MSKVIKVENLTREFRIRTNRNIFTGLFKPNYKVVKAVDGISFDVNEGESLAFLGPNGAGKTTTTKMLTGLIYPTSGTIKVLGFTPSDRKRDYLRQIGLVMGNKTGLSWDLTGAQSFDFIRKIYDIDSDNYRKNLKNLTTMLDIERHLDKQVRKLSLGERMKMELVGAILHQPKVLFLDEPTIGLDITSKKNIRVFLKSIQKDSNITIVLTSHDMEDVARVCDRVVIINRGMKVYDDNLAKLVSDYNKNKFIKVYFETLPGDFRTIDYVTVQKIENDAVIYEVRKDLVPRFISEVVNKYTILDLDIISVPLEEIIEDLFKKTDSIA